MITAIPEIFKVSLFYLFFYNNLPAPVAPPKKRPKKNNELLALLPPVDARKEIPRRKVSFKQRTEEEELALRNRYKVRYLILFLMLQDKRIHKR